MRCVELCCLGMTSVPEIMKNILCSNLCKRTNRFLKRNVFIVSKFDKFSKGDLLTSHSSDKYITKGL